MRTIAIEWQSGQPQGNVEVAFGKLVSLEITRGSGVATKRGFVGKSSGAIRLEVTVGYENVTHAANPTAITIHAAQPFTVLLRDINADYPVWIPEYGVVVTEAADMRTYEEITAAIRARGSQTVLQRIDAEREESYADAAAATRELHPPLWLGLSRDMRIFELPYCAGTPNYTIQPRFHGMLVKLPESDERDIYYNFMYGRGVGCVRDITRRLEDGVLPILHERLVDDDITYHTTAFVSLEKSPLTLEHLRGTHYLVSDGHGCGHMFTPEQAEEYNALLPGEMEREEETVLYYRIQAVNTGRMPRYAWFNLPHPNMPYEFDGEMGAGVLKSGRAFITATLNGTPLPKEEAAVLVKPGETATFEFFLPHRPISVERADRLRAQDFAGRHAECRAFWLEKLAAGTQLHLPEQRLEEMARAGLLHLDIVAYGLEPDGPVTANIGVYCPIGSESAPIIQFMDSMGWHDLARRSLMYFLEKQHDDGFIQNFGGYMLETGPALWSMGEHFRYTRDVAWVKAIKPKLLKACACLEQWRARNLKEELRGRGYGLMEGKVADPEDPFRCFMLNGYAYLGLSRVAEMLAEIDPAESARIGTLAGELKADLLTAVNENLAKAPVVPLGDGTWCPTIGPWAEARGLVSLLIDEYRWSTHGAFLARDSMIGPLYLILSEVLTPKERAADWVIKYHCDLMHMRNVAFSQPYYSPHPYLNLRRGEVKAFLKAYYNGFAGLSDRETYSFWEHYFHASPHKTHEEGWFLMQTRWMLYYEDGATLRLLPGIPRAWLVHGKQVKLENLATYFGPVSLQVESQVEQGRITARVVCATDRKPDRVVLRLPHPDNLRAVQVSGGNYDPATETVTITPFSGAAEVVVDFAAQGVGVRV